MNKQRLSEATAVSSINLANDMRHAISADILPFDIARVVGLATASFTVHGVALEVGCPRRFFAEKGQEIPDTDTRCGQLHRDFLYGRPLLHDITAHVITEHFFVALCSGNGVMLETHLHDLGFGRAASVTSSRCRIRPLAPGEDKSTFDI